MTGMTVFEKITDISDKFLEEAAFVPEMETVLTQKRRERGIGGFSRFINSGFGVAMICCLVAVGTIVGMVTWGRMGGSPPAGTVDESAGSTASDTNEPETIPPLLTEDFEPEVSFSIMQWLDLSWRGIQAGRSTTIKIGMTNEGKEFSYMGGIDSFHIDRAALVPSGGAYEDGYPCVILYRASTLVTVPTGTTGSYEATFHIPKDAPLGKYDLVVGYMSSEKVFEGVVTVWPDIDLPEEEVIALADAEIKRQTMLTDLSPYYVSVERQDNGQWNLEYCVYIQGYRTTDRIYLVLATDGSVIEYRPSHSIGDYTPYLSYVTAEMTAEAIARLIARLGDVDETMLYWTFGVEGYLCIGYSIVHDAGDCINIELVCEPVCPKLE